jgi:two-component system, cell cycle response regulator
MTLRVRLTLFFTGIVVVPLIAAAILLQLLVSQELHRRTDTRLEVGARAVAAVWQDRLGEARREVRRIAAVLPPAIDAPDLGDQIDRLREDRGLDFLILAGPDGDVRAASLGSPDFLPGMSAPGPAEIASEEGAAAALRARAPIDGEAAVVVGGWFVDRDFVEDLAGIAGTGVMLMSDEGTVASTVVPPPEIAETEATITDVGRNRRALITPIMENGGRVVLVARQEGPPLRFLLWLVAGAGVALATVIAYILAGIIVRPVNRLAEGARAVAEGRFDTRIEVGERGDVGHVAESFNVMTDYVRRYIEELEESRDELRRSLERLGTTLRFTHDLQGMLRAVLETAVATLGASSGAAFLLEAEGREMRLEVTNGFEPTVKGTLGVGRGVAGRAALGRPVLIPSEQEDIVPAAPLEPPASTAVAVPLIRGERAIGVLALYGRSLPEPFAEQDVATLASFAGQASVAIENVLLHEEAQRLSITDGLTGVWNRRYLQMMLVTEIERSQRFGRPLSVLLVDLDRFKRINDDHGHLVGDAVLVEVAQRMVRSVRSQIDSVARFGGEEFLLVLPETPPRGAHVVAEKIREAVSKEDIVVDEDTPPLRVTVSIGIASVPADGATTDDLLRAADDAMYLAKEKGRDRIESSRASASSLKGNTL